MDNFLKLAASMPQAASALSKLRHHFTRGLSSLSKEDARGLRRKTMRNTGGVPDSLLMMPFTAAAKKLKGNMFVQRGLWNKLHKPSLSADTAAGNVAHDVFKHVPGMRKLFLQSEKIPVGRSGEKLYKEIQRPSALAPATKATALAAPFAVGMTAEKALKDIRKKEDAKDHPTSVE